MSAVDLIVMESVSDALTSKSYDFVQGPDGHRVKVGHFDLASNRDMAESVLLQLYAPGNTLSQRMLARMPDSMIISPLLYLRSEEAKKGRGEKSVDISVLYMGFIPLIQQFYIFDPLHLREHSNNELPVFPIPFDQLPNIQWSLELRTCKGFLSYSGMMINFDVIAHVPTLQKPGVMEFIRQAIAGKFDADAFWSEEEQTAFEALTLV